MSNKLILSEYGTAGKIYALGVQGDEEFLRLTENLLVNYGVIDYRMAKFHRLCDTFGYFVIDLQKFEEALIEYFHNMLWLEKKTERIGGKYWSINLARNYIKSIEREDFMRHIKSDDDHEYKHT